MNAIGRAVDNWPMALALIALSVVLGLAIPIAFGLSSVSGGGSTAHYQPSQSPSPSAQAGPSPQARPTPTAAGVLGTEPKLAATGGTGLVAATLDHVYVRRDGAADWIPFTGPSNTSGIVADLANPSVMLVGGPRILASSDGSTWKAPRATPPAGGSYQPLLVNPDDANVWFFNHQGRLLRTRDGGVSWRELTTVPALTNPVLVHGPVRDQFFLASGSRVVQLDNNGEAVIDRGSVPAGATISGLVLVATAQSYLLARASDGHLYLGRAAAWTPAGSALEGPVAAVPDKFILVANGGAMLKQPGRIIVSTDQGTTWKAASGLPDDQTIEAVTAAPDASRFFAYGFGGDMFSSTDGLSWAFVDSNLRGG